MTVSKYILDFLNKFENITIDTNHISDGSDKNGLFKSPSRDKIEFNDGSCKITEYYQLLARQSSVSDIERKESDEWLEELIYWIDDYGILEEYPEIDGNRIVKDISVTGVPAPLDYENDEIIYQISLSITYTREREES